MPRQSKPGPTLEVEPGAYAVTRSIGSRTRYRNSARPGEPGARDRGVSGLRATIAAMSLLGGLSLSRPRLIDRYIAREMVAPTGIGLLVFTFVLLIDQIPRLLAVLVARSADFSTILRVFLNLLPSILAITIPMAFLLGVLLAFGRMASDSEIVALRAVGVSPLRLLQPVMMLALVMTAITFYINAVALPAANQAHREIVFSLVVSKARTDVKARTFTDNLLPGRMMLYVQDIEPGTGLWKNLLIHDTRDIAESKLILARTGELVVDKQHQIVRVELGPGSQHSFFGADPRAYSRTSFRSMGWDLPVDEFFPDRKKLLLAKGDREMSLPELADKVAEIRAQGKPRSDWGRFAVEWHKKFAIPGRLPGVRPARAGALARQQEGGALVGLRAVDRRDLRLLRADPARRAGRRHRGDAALARDVGRQRGAGRAGAGAAVPEPPRGGLRPARRLALHALLPGDPPAAPRRSRPSAGPVRRGRPRRGPWWWCGSPA